MTLNRVRRCGHRARLRPAAIHELGTYLSRARYCSAAGQPSRSLPEGVTPRLNLLSYAPESDGRQPRRAACSASSPGAPRLHAAARCCRRCRLSCPSSWTWRAPKHGCCSASIRKRPSSAGAGVAQHRRRRRTFRRPELRDDPLAPILDAPEFPQPMYEALRDLSQDFLFPGLEHVPPNTVTLLETNSEIRRIVPGRIERRDEPRAALAQLSDRPARHLFPAVLGYVGRRRAAGHRSDPPTGATERARRERAARANSWCCSCAASCCGAIPNSVIYAVAAVRNDSGQLELSSDPADEAHPLFRGTLKPDVTFLGFDLTKRRGASPIPAGSSSSSSNRPSRASGWTSRTSQSRCRRSATLERSELAASGRHRSRS